MKLTAETHRGGASQEPKVPTITIPREFTTQTIHTEHERTNRPIPGCGELAWRVQGYDEYNRINEI